MKTFKELLIKLDACDDACKFVQNQSVKEALNTCERGDWILWLAKKIDLPIRPITLAKARCARTVIHLMKDQRSIDAVNAAEKYGLNEITDDDLKKAAAAAYAAASFVAPSAPAAAVAVFAAAAASDAAVSASYDVYDVADYTANAAASAAVYDDAGAAKRKNQLQTAEICREILGELIINRVNELLK